ncbi:MAG: FAD:protein FMN transferase, partial [Marinirhabdus sp.]|nr:FAD:protein FMN transferase [Marinirhabdus sp.]
PLTGLAQETNVTSATILASTCAVADAYATACMAMGFEGAKAMLEATSGIEGYLTYISDDKEAATFSTEGFQEQMKGNTSE